MEDRRKYLRDMLDELDRYLDELEREIQDAIRSSLDSSKKLFSKPFVAGITMRFGPEGRPLIEFFGDKASEEHGYRTPIYEQVIDDKDGRLRLIIELPGVEKGDIEISADEDEVRVKAERGNRKYMSTIELKREVNPETGVAEYKNGILEVSFLLKDKTNKGYRRVSVV